MVDLLLHFKIFCFNFLQPFRKLEIALNFILHSEVELVNCIFQGLQIELVLIYKFEINEACNGELNFGVCSGYKLIILGCEDFLYFIKGN